MYYIKNGLIENKPYRRSILQNRIGREIAEIATNPNYTSTRISVEKDKESILYTIKTYKGLKLNEIIVIGMIN